MKLRIGIVGLPNVGKSTLFNALVKSSVAEAANYPFCTIEPNVGIVDIPDQKLPKLAEVAKSTKVVPAAIEFVDIAGLVKGASKGEGLGNQFLSHIREVDAIILVLRDFEDSTIIKTGESPLEDKKTIEIELMLADLQTLTKRKETIKGDVKTGSDEARVLATAIDKAIELLEQEKPLRDFSTSSRNDETGFTDKEIQALKSLSLLTLKPLMVVLNVSEDEAKSEARDPRFRENDAVIRVSARIEAEIAQLSPEESKEFLQEIGLEESGLDRVARAAYQLLGLQSYYTAGEKEARAWTIKQGNTAPQAAGVIHTDFEKGFIAAEIISYQDFVTLGGWGGGRPAGKVRTEGKTYVMQPNDVVLFRFNV